MAENLDSDPLKEAEAKINKLIESGIDVETLQQLLQTAATNEATIKHPDTSPLNNSTEDGNPKTENIIQEGSGSHENGTESEELSPDDFAAAPKEIGNVNNDLKANLMSLKMITRKRMRIKNLLLREILLGKAITLQLVQMLIKVKVKF